MTPTPGDPVLLNHFTVAIYPFVHDLTPANRAARLHALDRRWAPWWARLTDHEAADALDGASFFLPYIRGLLYPEIAGLQGEPPGEHYAHWIHLIRRRGADGLRAWLRRLPDDAVLRLTGRAALHYPLSAFTLAGRRGAAGKTDLPTEVLRPPGLDRRPAVPVRPRLSAAQAAAGRGDADPGPPHRPELGRAAGPPAEPVVDLADAALRRRRGGARRAT